MSLPRAFLFVILACAAPVAHAVGPGTYDYGTVNGNSLEFTAPLAAPDAVLTVGGAAQGPNIRPWIGRSLCTGCPAGSLSQRIRLSDLQLGQQVTIVISTRYSSSATPYAANITEGTGVVASSGSTKVFPVGSVPATWRISLTAQSPTVTVTIGNSQTTGTHYAYIDALQVQILPTFSQKLRTYYTGTMLQRSTGSYLPLYAVRPAQNGVEAIAFRQQGDLLSAFDQSNNLLWSKSLLPSPEDTPSSPSDRHGAPMGGIDMNADGWPDLVQIYDQETGRMCGLINRTRGFAALIDGKTGAIRTITGAEDDICWRFNDALQEKNIRSWIGHSTCTGCPAGTINQHIRLANLLPGQTVKLDVHIRYVSSGATFSANITEGSGTIAGSGSTFTPVAPFGTKPMNWRISLTAQSPVLKVTIGNGRTQGAHYAYLDSVQVSVLSPADQTPLDPGPYLYGAVDGASTGFTGNDSRETLFVGSGAVTYPTPQWFSKSAFGNHAGGKMAMSVEYPAKGFFYDGLAPVTQAPDYYQHPSTPAYDAYTNAQLTSYGTKYRLNSHLPNGIFLPAGTGERFVFFTSGRVVQYAVAPYGPSQLVFDRPFLNGNNPALGGRNYGRVAADPYPTSASGFVAIVAGASVGDLLPLFQSPPGVDSNQDGGLERHVTLYNYLNNAIDHRFYSSKQIQVNQPYIDRPVAPLSMFLRTAINTPSRLIYNIFSNGRWTLHISQPGKTADALTIPDLFVWDARDLDGDGVTDVIASPTTGCLTPTTVQAYCLPDRTTQVLSWNEQTTSLTLRHTFPGVIPYLAQSLDEPANRTTYGPYVTGVIQTGAVRSLMVVNQAGQVQLVGL